MTDNNACSRKAVFCSEAESRECHHYGVSQCTFVFYSGRVKLFMIRPLKSYPTGTKIRAGDTRSGVNNFFVNTIVTALQGSDWERLLGRYARI